MNITKKDILNHQDTIAQLLDTDVKKVTVQFDDTSVIMKRKYAILYLHFWWIPLKWNIPLTSDFMFEDPYGIVSNPIMAKLYTKMYKAIMEAHGSAPKISYDFGESINSVNNFVLTECNDCHYSVSILDLAKLAKEPRVKAIRDKVRFSKLTPTSVVEETLADLTDDMIELLKDPTLENNILYPYHRLGMINHMQLPQMLVGIGTRTDVNDDLIRWPINSNYLSGIKGNLDWMCESLSAKKAVAYLRNAVRKSQYFNRTCVLATSILKYVYKDDCGSTVTVPFQVTETNAHNLMGKYHVIDGELSYIGKHNYQDYIGQKIELRSPITCKHQDGICRICGGELSQYLEDGFKLGTASTIEATNPITQLILSHKHFQSTSSLTYVPPKALKELLVARKDQVYFRSKFCDKLKDLALGVPIKNMSRISDLHTIKNDSGIDPEYFSKITHIAMKDLSTNEIITKTIPISHGGIEPFFAKEMLMYIRDNYKDMDIGNTIWIPLKGYNIDNPVFSSTVVNDSMIKFVSMADKYLTGDIAKHTTAEEALRDFSDHVYSKVKINIMHLEVMLKALLVTNQYDMSIPIVEDQEDVRFQGTKSICVRRSFGTFFSYERLLNVLKSAETYLVPRDTNSFDQFLGFEEK